MGGQLVLRTGARVIAFVGIALAAVSYALLALTAPTVAALTLEPIPLGIGTGMAVGAIFDVATFASPLAMTAGTLGVSSTIRLVFAALGAQVSVAILTAAPPAFPALRLLIVHLQHVRATGVHLQGAGGAGVHLQRAGAAAAHLEQLAAAARIPSHSGFTSAFWMAAASTVVALLAVSMMPSRRTDPTLLRNLTNVAGQPSVPHDVV